MWDKRLENRFNRWLEWESRKMDSQVRFESIDKIRKKWLIRVQMKGELE